MRANASPSVLEWKSHRTISAGSTSASRERRKKRVMLISFVALSSFCEQRAAEQLTAGAGWCTMILAF